MTFCLISAGVKTEMKGILPSEILTICDRFQFPFPEINSLPAIGQFGSLLNYPPIVTLTLSYFIKGAHSSQGPLETGSHYTLAFASAFIIGSLTVFILLWTLMQICTNTYMGLEPHQYLCTSMWIKTGQLPCCHQEFNRCHASGESEEFIARR